MALPPRVYRYRQFGRYLEDLLDYHKKQNDKYSIRWLARQLEYKTHSFLVKIIKGEKTATDNLVDRIARTFEIDPEQTAFARMMVKLENAKAAGERQYFASELEKMIPRETHHLLEGDEVELFSDWVQIAIYEMLDMVSGKLNTEDIGDRLRTAVAPERIDRAVRFLLKNRFMDETEPGVFRKTRTSLTTVHNVSNQVVRSHHLQSLDLAREAIVDLPVNRRCVLSHTMAFQETRFKESSDACLEFRSMFDQRFQTTSGDSVYQLLVQWFPLTRTSADKR